MCLPCWMIHQSCLVFQGKARIPWVVQWLVGWTLLMVVTVGDDQRVMTGVGLQDEDFGWSVERDLLWGLLLLSLCFLCVVLGSPQSLAEGLVQGIGFLLPRCTLQKTMFLCLKWWVTRVALESKLGLLLWFNLVRVEICELRPKGLAKGDEVLIHYRSRTNMWWGLSSKMYS